MTSLADYGRPGDLAVDRNGNAWFTDADNDSLGLITTSGSISEFKIPTPNSYPNGIVIGDDGAVWFTEYNGGKIGRFSEKSRDPSRSQQP